MGHSLYSWRNCQCNAFPDSGSSTSVLVFSTIINILYLISFQNINASCAAANYTSEFLSYFLMWTQASFHSGWMRDTLSLKYLRRIWKWTQIQLPCSRKLKPSGFLFEFIWLFYVSKCNKFNFWLHLGALILHLQWEIRVRMRTFKRSLVLLRVVLR